MTDEEPRRPTAAERAHEVTMHLLRGRVAMPEYSIELVLNAKGDVQVKVGANGPDRETVETECAAIFDRLIEKYPRADPTGAA